MMVLDAEGNFHGTIGGGIMEVKLLELARDMMNKGATKALVKLQYHDKQHSRNQSGMICSGEQTVVLVPLYPKDSELIQSILHEENISLGFQPEGLTIFKDKQQAVFRIENERDFEIKISLPNPPRVHIFGAGHVGLALSQIMSLLNYKVCLYDDRPHLNTYHQNSFADEKKIVDYENIQEECELSENDIIVLVTFSYRTDKLLLKQLFNQTFAYIGMMGSDAKIAQLFAELETEGISPSDLEHVHAPIGMEIYSKTTMEIAISISGEIIKTLNQTLPTGRMYGNKK